MFHARLDAVSGGIRYVDAGHGLSLVVRAAGGAERLRTTSLPLDMGLEDGWPEHTVELAPGDTLVSVSDGVLDLWGGDLGSLDEVERIVRSAPHAQHIVDSLLAMAASAPPQRLPRAQLPYCATSSRLSTFPLGPSGSASTI